MGGKAKRKLSRLTGAGFEYASHVELEAFLKERRCSYPGPKMHYEKILLAKGSVEASHNFLIHPGSVVSRTLTLPYDPECVNTCIVIDGDLVVKNELWIEDMQGLIVLGDIRVGEFLSDDGELFAHRIWGERFVAIDVESGGLVDLESVHAPVVIHDTGYWDPPFKIVASKEIKIAGAANPALSPRYEQSGMHDLYKALQRGKSIWASPET